MTGLAKYEAAEAALSEAVNADEVMEIHLTAKGIEAVARVAKNFDLELKACKLRVRAETKLGGMLADAEEKGIFRPGRRIAKESNGADAETLDRVKLKDIGVDARLSARAQRLNGIGARAVNAMLDRFEQESNRRGKVARDVLDSEDRDRKQASRRNLELALSDASEKLKGGRKFPTIYADPATRFLSGFGDRSIENHYPTMTLKQICDLPVVERALPNCRLFIWSTVPQLANTFAIADAWGFADYSSHMVWDKTDVETENLGGTGHVFRNQHELLLYFKRGKPAGPTRGTQPLSIYRERKTDHSRKPEYFRQVIIDLTDNLPVLELFARVDAEHPLPEGWQSWGNQASQPTDAAGNVIEHDHATGETA